VTVKSSVSAATRTSAGGPAAVDDQALAGHERAAGTGEVLDGGAEIIAELTPRLLDKVS